MQLTLTSELFYNFLKLKIHHMSPGRGKSCTVDVNKFQDLFSLLCCELFYMHIIKMCIMLCSSARYAMRFSLAWQSQL